MYVRITPLGIAVSGVETETFGQSGFRRAEFSFFAVTPHGGRWQFRYQIDAMGMAAWHLYHEGDGGDIPAMDARSRKSLGSLPVDHTDRDIDALLRRVDDNPSVTTYLLAPGHPDARKKPDFIVFTLEKQLIARLRAFVSASEAMVASGVANGIVQNIRDARCFFLDQKTRNVFLSEGSSELARIGLALSGKGFFMYSSGGYGEKLSDLPPLIRQAMESANYPRIDLRLEKSDRFGIVSGALTDAAGRPLGVIRNASHIFAAYEGMVRQSRRQEAREEMPEVQDEYERLGQELL